MRKLGRQGGGKAAVADVGRCIGGSGLTAACTGAPGCSVRILPGALTFASFCCCLLRSTSPSARLGPCARSLLTPGNQCACSVPARRPITTCCCLQASIRPFESSCHWRVRIQVHSVPRRDVLYARRFRVQRVCHRIVQPLPEVDNMHALPKVEVQ